MSSEADTILLFWVALSTSSLGIFVQPAWANRYNCPALPSSDVIKALDRAHVQAM